MRKSATFTNPHLFLAAFFFFEIWEIYLKNFGMEKFNFFYLAFEAQSFLFEFRIGVGQFPFESVGLDDRMAVE